MWEYVLSLESFLLDSHLGGSRTLLRKFPRVGTSSTTFSLGLLTGGVTLPWPGDSESSWTKRGQSPDQGVFVWAWVILILVLNGSSSTLTVPSPSSPSPGGCRSRVRSRDHDVRPGSPLRTHKWERSPAPQSESLRQCVHSGSAKKRDWEVRFVETLGFPFGGVSVESSITILRFRRLRQ